MWDARRQEVGSRAGIGLGFGASGGRGSGESGSPRARAIAFPNTLAGKWDAGQVEDWPGRLGIRPDLLLPWRGES